MSIFGNCSPHMKAVHAHNIRQCRHSCKSCCKLLRIIVLFLIPKETLYVYSPLYSRSSSFCGLGKQGQIKVAASTESQNLGDSSDFTWISHCSYQVWLGPGWRALLCRTASSGHRALEEWSLSLVLKVSRGGSFYSMVIISGCFLCYSPCVAGYFPSCVQVESYVFVSYQRKVDSEKGSKVQGLTLFWDSVQLEPYISFLRCRKASMKSIT